MSVLMNPYVSLDGTAAEAVAFYADVFGAQPQVMTFGDAGAEGAPPDGVMHAYLESPDGLKLMLSDLPPGSTRERGNDLAISLSGDDADKLRGWWERLSEGGQVTVPLEKQMWGDVFGACTDRFGVSWMVNITDAGS